MNQFCSVQECENTADTRGLCGKHYMRWLRNGTTDIIRKRNTCVVDGCNEYVYGQGLCHLHYSRMRRHGDADRLSEPKRVATPPATALPDHLTRDQWVAWAAGFFDGEGTMRIRRVKGKNSFYLELQVCQINPAPLTILQSLFGGVVKHVRSRKANWRDKFSWYAGTSQGVNALTEMLPCLIVKRAEAEVVMTFMETVQFSRKPLAQETIVLREQLQRRLTELKHREYAIG